ncbi:MAG: trigger factor [Thermodesulfovibrionales bacterium]
MAVTIEDISTTKKKVRIEIPADVVMKEYAVSLNSVRQRAKIPGFRPGRAPMPMIEKKFGGDIRTDLIDRLVPDYYTKALREASLVPVAVPAFDEAPELQKDKPLAFSFTVEVKPKLGEIPYAGMKVADIPVVVEEREIDETINGIREQKAVFEVVDREVRADDLVVIDYVKLDPAGEREVASAQDRILNLGNNLTPQGILDAVLGKRKGDVVPVTLPAAGQETGSGEATGDQLRITIKEVKEKKLPALDEEFAKDLGYDTMEALRAKVLDGLTSAKQDNAARQQKAKLIDELVGGQSFEVPDAMLEHELKNLVASAQAKQAETGGEPSEIPGLEEELRPKALKNVRAALILEEIAEREKIVVTEEEMKARIASIARSLQATPEAVINLFVTRDGSLDNLRHSIREDKTLDLVLSKAEKVKGA